MSRKEAKAEAERAFKYIDLPSGKTVASAPTLEALLEAVNHPAHYGGGDNPYEAIKVIEAWNLGFCLGNTIKYISRAGKKDNNSELQDLKKALWYLERRIGQLEGNSNGD